MKKDFQEGLCRKSEIYRNDIYKDILKYYENRMREYNNRSRWTRIKDYFRKKKVRPYYPDEHNTSFIRIVNKLYNNFPIIDDENNILEYYFPELAKNSIPNSRKIKFYNDIHRINTIQAAIRDSSISL